MQLEELIKKSKDGQSEAFAEIYDQFADKIFRFIKIKIQNQEQAEDVLQEVFLKAWQGLKNLRLENLNFSAWLYTITRNAINDYYRKYYRAPKIAELDENLEAIAIGESQEKILDSKFARQNIQKSFEELPVQYKEVLEMRFIQDFSPEETALILGKSNLAIRLAQHRALKKLKNIMEKNYDF